MNSMMSVRASSGESTLVERVNFDQPIDGRVKESKSSRPLTTIMQLRTTFSDAKFIE